MLKINFNFLPDSTNGRLQIIKDSVTDFAGKSFLWIRDTHRNESVDYGMFAIVTTVSFLVAQQLTTTLGPQIDAKYGKDCKEMTSDRKQRTGILFNGVITGGLTYAGNLLYSTLSGRRLPQTIMLAIAVAACAFRYLLHSKREANLTLLPTVTPDVSSTRGDKRDTGVDRSENDINSLNPSYYASSPTDEVEKSPSSPGQIFGQDVSIECLSSTNILTPSDQRGYEDDSKRTNQKGKLSNSPRSSINHGSEIDEASSDNNQSTVPGEECSSEEIARAIPSSQMKASDTSPLHELPSRPYEQGPIEFIKPEMERGLSNGSISIEETIPDPIPFWKGRTSEINQSISKAFQAIAHDTSSLWSLFNGEDTYDIGGIKEHKLMRKIIREAPPECKNFYALDIGAGNYQWGRGLAKYLNGKNDIPKDIIIHIIGIRGEANVDQAVTELGQCKLYEFGRFQIETLEDEFQQRGLQLANKVDLVVSRWCFRHLVDPVGTFTQAYDLLRPKTGHLLIDGFFFLHENEEMYDNSLDFNDRMTQLCLELHAPFLTRYYYSERSLNHFVVNKQDGRRCDLKKQYLGTESVGSSWGIGSETLTRFKELKETDVKTSLLYEGDFRGDKDLYERLRQNGLLRNSDSRWGPLQDKDTNRKTPPLHIAITSGDEEAIYRCLQEGCDINESDDMGSTPLHLAIKHNNYKLFSLLLEKRAQTNLFVSECSPLHLATQYDLDGCFIRALILAGADVNIKPSGFVRSRLTPLEFAIKNKNIKAVELLLEAKAIFNYESRKSLDSDPTFSSIQHLLPKRLSELEGFNTIIDHIKRGDCVLLAYPGATWAYKFKNTTQLKNSKLIQVTVNPETRLLNDKNYEEIKAISGCNEVLESNYMMGKVPHPELQFEFGY